MTAQDLGSALDWRNGQPYSRIFEDVYFSSDDGWAETQHVFIDGNQLPQRWQMLDYASFSIIETGFGTGLNFWCAVLAWLQHAPQPATLHFTSIEKYPLSLAEMQQALTLWPDLTTFVPQFLAHYATLQAGLNRWLLLDGRVELSLWVGDVLEVLPPLHQACDAWFLDGFAPAKNPEMWQPAVYAQMARLSNNRTTFATFTSAGMVRRGLMQAGFQVRKQVGFGRKREMLLGSYPT